MGSEGPEKVDVKEARRQIGSGEAVAVDVRSKEEWTEAHVPGRLDLGGLQRPADR